MEGRRGEDGSAIRKGQSRAAALGGGCWGLVSWESSARLELGVGGRRDGGRDRWRWEIEIEIETAWTRHLQKPNNVSQQSLSTWCFGSWQLLAVDLESVVGGLGLAGDCGWWC